VGARSSTAVNIPYGKLRSDPQGVLCRSSRSHASSTSAARCTASTASPRRRPSEHGLAGLTIRSPYAHHTIAPSNRCAPVASAGGGRGGGGWR
jgi:hypothetical protein